MAIEFKSYIVGVASWLNLTHAAYLLTSVDLMQPNLWGSNMLLQSKQRINNIYRVYMACILLIPKANQMSGHISSSF